MDSSTRDVSSKDIFHLVGGGLTGDAFRSIDWADHDLGASGLWPLELRTTLGLMFNSQHPMSVLWGENFIQFYNDSYLPTISSDKQPEAMGQRAVDCWPELWNIIKPLIKTYANLNMRGFNLIRSPLMSVSGVQLESWRGGHPFQE